MDHLQAVNCEDRQEKIDLSSGSEKHSRLVLGKSSRTSSSLVVSSSDHAGHSPRAFDRCPTIGTYC